MSKTWMQTAHGGAFELRYPDPKSVRIEDIAHQLSQINRFTGATRWPYSVAQHSVHVSYLVEPKGYAFEALMHDAHEAYVGDVSTPLKRTMREIARDFGRRSHSDYDRVEMKAREVVVTRFLLRDSRDISWAIKQADLIACATEKAHLMAPQPKSWGDLPESDPHGIGIVLDAGGAREMFLDRFDQLVRGRAVA